jgi:protein gp37
MKNSSIEWTHHTFNPWIGCTRVSPGCQHCYAETMMDKRYGKVKWGPQGKRMRTSTDYWKQPLKWNREAAAAGERRRVFCASLADVFESKRDQARDMHSWRSDLFSLIRMTPHLDWLLLTKRPEMIFPLFPWFITEIEKYPNVWIGTSVENQEYADKRIPELLKIPAAVRFLSVEPLLGPVNLLPYLQMQWTGMGEETPMIDWVIVGGESGPGARPMHPDWARALRDQCRAAEVPFFMKQMGGARDKGGDLSAIPEDLRTRQFPTGVGMEQAHE